MKEWRESAKDYMINRLSLRVHACPFCGSVRTGMIKSPSYHVLCFNCGADTFFCEQEHDPNQTIDHYNMRDQKLEAKLKLNAVYGKAALDAGKEEDEKQ